MSVIEQKVIPERLVNPVISRFTDSGLDVWLYQGADWLIRDPNGAARGT